MFFVTSWLALPRHEGVNTDRMTVGGDVDFPVAIGSEDLDCEIDSLVNDLYDLTTMKLRFSRRMSNADNERAVMFGEFGGSSIA